MLHSIKITGARENNLKNISLEIPRNKFVVLTGVSGSGKSSLAFDTIYAEGQRRYVESLSTHARQFLNQMGKPDVDSIDGLSPSISIQQRVAYGSPRSTVGTTTEIYDYMRVLFARAGQVYCPGCGKPIYSQSNQEIVDQILRRKGEEVMVLSPVVRGQKGDFEELIQDLQKAGFTRARIDGKLLPLNDGAALRKNQTHDIDVLIDRLKIEEESQKRLSESVSMGLNMGKGVVSAVFNSGEVLFSELNACPDCEISIGSLTPGMFSFNSPYGACELCHGLGMIDLLDPDLMVVDEDRSILEGAIPLITIEDVPMVETNKKILKKIADHCDVDLETPWRDLKAEHKSLILDGSDDLVLKMTVWEAGKPKVREEKFEGFRKMFFDRFRSTEKSQPKDIIRRYMSPGVCPSCQGKRLKRESLNVRVDQYNIIDLTDQPIESLLESLKKINLTPFQKTIAKDIVKEILARLQFLKDVGLGYLTLSRRSNTLGGGEAQRIKLATQIGSGLLGVLYVLDEPTIGLHPRDVSRLLKSLKRLKTIGNSVLVVEHDEATIREAEYLVELGPRAGVGGGMITFNGPMREFLNSEALTAQYLSHKIQIPIPKTRRKVDPENMLVIEGCRENNLKNITVRFPLNCLVAVTGVSGSGKSTLVHRTLHKALQQRLTRSKVMPGSFSNLKGYEEMIQSVIEINQTPIGRTPRSNPATYTGVFDLIRDWYAKLPEAQMRGFKASHFSFNVRGGRCEACTGDGVIKIEMHFLPDVYVPCDVCKGKRYDREILAVKYKNKSISDVLNSTVEEAILDFKNIGPIYEKLKLLEDVGLGYIKLGQSATTLSGGEAQRVKLAGELGNKTRGNTVYILDEPTTGLHFADIHVLLDVLQRLVNAGNSVIVIEHNLDVIAASDYIIDLGPEGGNKGGEVIVTGTPEEVIQVSDSYTGQFLKEHFRELGRK